MASLGSFLISLDILIVNVSLVEIRRDLGGDTVALQWVVDGYTVPFAALLLTAGNLADRIGAKQAFAWGVAGFAFASLACGLAPTIELLVLARVVKGISAAAMLPASLAAIRQAFPDSRARSKALGLWAVGGAVAGGIGPLVGGALTTIDWRLVFVVNVPVCMAMIALMRVVPASSRQPSRFDWRGQIASAVSLTALVWGLIEGGARGRTQPSVLAALTAAVLGLVGFIAIQRRSTHPMMPLELFRVEAFRIALAVGFVFILCWFGTVFVMSLYLQQELGLTPLTAGLVFLPASLLSIVGNAASGFIANRYSPRVPIVIGLGSIAAGLVGVVLTVPLESPWVLSLCLLLIGPGGAIAMPPTTSVILDSVPAERSGIASAIFNTFRQVGGAIAIAVFGTVLESAATYTTGLRISLGVAAILAAAVALLALRVRTR
ncbi:MFS transporter [Pseudactinotalea sp. Z1739]|uniref:MFS transporter n=1 Tax=Pseudactinotalea sp. Z1739 TaxID=3413028 RepID=UPI003C7B0278